MFKLLRIIFKSYQYVLENIHKNERMNNPKYRIYVQ